jgi:hypothetical protein
MRTATSLILGLLTGVGCLSSGTPGGVEPVDVDAGLGDLSETDTATADTAVIDTAVIDIAVIDTAEPDTGDTSAPDTLGPDTSVQVCGDGVWIADEEECDDGNGCDLDGCVASSCTPIQTVVLYALALDGAVSFDLDDADGDHDVATGGDNRLGGNGLVASVVNPLIAQSIEQGRVIQLVTLNGFDDAEEDPMVSLVFHPGIDASCPTQTPVSWLESHHLSPFFFSDSRAWAGCVPPLAITGSISRTPPSSASPDGPVLSARSETPLTIPAGPLGDLTVARSHLEATVTPVNSYPAVDLRHGRLGGVVPASTLYQIDTSSLLPGCPTALHAVLALVGHIDQDAEGNGAKDWIQFTLGGSQPCIADPVTIVGCCNDGDCDDFVPGAACALDPKIRDGYSAGFRFEARAAVIINQVDGATWCSE